jgi:hypothetical protein
MNTIAEACDKIKEHLTDWYNKNKKRGMYSADLHAVKQKFIEDNPDYKKFDFDINVGFETIPETYISVMAGCGGDCCSRGDSIKCRGVYAVPINWSDAKHIAFKNSKTLALIKTLC